MSSSNRSRHPHSDRPSLKQRAAELEAGLARVVRRPGAEATEAADPAFEVVANYQAAWDALGAAIEAGGGEEAPEAEDACSAAYARLRAVRPTTPAGFQALAETWAWRLRAERATPATGGDGTHTVGADAADSLIAGAGVCVPLASQAEGNEPWRVALADVGLTSEISEDVFAAIEDHRDIMAATATLVEDDEGFDCQGEMQNAAERAVAQAPVRSIADLRAKLTYLIPIIAPDMLDRTHVGHLEAIRADVDRMCRTDRDWAEFASHHPGFLPFPQLRPVCLMALDRAIPQEAARLLALAEEEFERRRQAYVGFHDPAVWPSVAAELRRDMRMDALAAAAAPARSKALVSEADPIFAAIQAHAVAREAFSATVNPQDRAWVAQNGGDTSDKAMAPRPCSL